MGFGGGDFMGGPMSLGQFGYMAEQENQYGMINDESFKAALAQIKSELAWAKDLDFNAKSDVDRILWSYGINPSDLTKNHISRINRVL